MDSKNTNLNQEPHTHLLPASPSRVWHGGLESWGKLGPISSQPGFRVLTEALAPRKCCAGNPGNGQPDGPRGTAVATAGR